MLKNKPNILMIMSDEHTWNISGCYNNKIVKTPNIDKIAEKGILFENCYTPSPLCVPARLAFTAGKYISRCGAWGNESMLESDEYPSLPRQLKKAGYDSYLIGKMHYDKNRRYGFIDEHPEFNQFIKTNVVPRVNIENDEYKKDVLSERFSQFYPGDINESRNSRNDMKVTKYSVDFLNNRKKDDKPFFLLTGYNAPHFPLIVPEQYYEMYKNKVPMPIIPENYFESEPKNYEILRYAFDMQNVPEDIVKRGRELYYGLVTWLDNEVGKVLDALKNSQVADNTIVIYTTDHGENLGEHGLWWKNNMYDHAAKIPCIVSWPGRWSNGSRRSEVCNLLDVGQTILEICGAESPDDWDGESLCSILDNQQDHWKNYTVSEYYAHYIGSGYCMVRKDNYKYVYFNRINDKYGEEYQLFDLEMDPGEFNNLAYRKEFISLRKQLHELLVKEIGREPCEAEKEARQYMK